MIDPIFFLLSELDVMNLSLPNSPREARSRQNNKFKSCYILTKLSMLKPLIKYGEMALDTRVGGAPAGCKSRL